MLGRTFLVAAFMGTLPFVSAIGKAAVKNYCNYQITVYTTQPGGGSVTGTYKLAPGKSKNIPYPSNGMTGSQVRVSPNNTPNTIVYFEFAQGNNIIYYDVNVNMSQDPFPEGLSVTGSDASCPSISCAAGGSLACFNNPNGNLQNQVKACQAVNSITFNACLPLQ